MRRGTPRRSEQNELLDEEIGKIPELRPKNFCLDAYIPEQGSYEECAQLKNVREFLITCRSNFERSVKRTPRPS